MGAAIFGFYALIFCALSIHHVSYAVLALICMFAFEQWGGIYVSFVALNGSLVNLFILALVGLAWLRLPAGATFEFIQYPTRTLLMFFVGYIFVSTLWAPTDADATARFLNEFHYIFAGLFVAPLLIRSSADFTRLLDAVTWVGGSLVILFAFVPDFEGRSLLVEYDLEETLSLPLALGDFGGLVAVVTFLRIRSKFVILLWSLLVTGSALFLITKTGSRGPLFFSLITMLVCFPLRWKGFSLNRGLTLVLVALIAVGAAYLVINTENTLSIRMESSGDNFGDELGTIHRVDAARDILDKWLGQPSSMVFGMGSSASWSRTMLSGYSHVVPIEILVELGLFGLLLFGTAMLTLFLRAFTGSTRSKMTEESTRNFAALFGCWLFVNLLYLKQGSTIFAFDLFMFTALAEKCLRLGSSSSGFPSRRKRKLIQRPTRSATTQQ